jgi:anti-sigma B factor antagonist
VADESPRPLRTELSRESVDATVIATVAFEGDLDLPAVDRFRAAMTADQFGDADAVILDLTDVRFIDSSGVHALVDTCEALRSAPPGAEIVIGRGSNVERVLEMSGLLEQMRAVPDRRAAVHAITRRRR